MRILGPLFCVVLILGTDARGDQPDEKKELEKVIKELGSNDREVRLAAVMAPTRTCRSWPRKYWRSKANEPYSPPFMAGNQ